MYEKPISKLRSESCLDRFDQGQQSLLFIVSAFLIGVFLTGSAAWALVKVLPRSPSPTTNSATANTSVNVDIPPATVVAERPEMSQITIAQANEKKEMHRRRLTSTVDISLERFVATFERSRRSLVESEDVITRFRDKWVEWEASISREARPHSVSDAMGYSMVINSRQDGCGEHSADAWCFFGSQSRDGLLSLEMGDRVRVRGKLTVNGYDFWLSDCSLVE